MVCRKDGKRPRPVITIVDAKPMCETGFRQEQKSAECPKPSPRDSNKTSVSDPLSPDANERSSISVIQTGPESKPGTKPTKPQRNFAVEYNPALIAAVPDVAPVMQVKRSVSPENVTTSNTRPVPRPRPRSMVVSRSEPMSIASQQKDAKNDKQPPVRPEPATASVTKPHIIQPLIPQGPKGYRMVGSSIFYDGKTNGPPRPPPVKPKPVRSPTHVEANKKAEHASAKIPPEVVRRKPTIIRPVSQLTSSSSAEQTVNAPASTADLPPQSQTTVTTTTASNAVDSCTETNGWNKPASQTHHDVVCHADTQPATAGAKPQPKKRPTIIRMNKPELSNTGEPSGNAPPLSDSADQKQFEASPQSSVEVHHRSSVQGSESRSPTGADSQISAYHDSAMPVSRQLVNHESEDHDLKPVPHSQSQPLHSTEQELNQKIPPAKPPPPKVLSTEDQKTNV